MLNKDKGAYRSILFWSVFCCLIYSDRSTIEVIYNEAFLHYTVYIYVFKRTKQSIPKMFARSLGCGIGYGYLHRIPALPEASTAKPPTPVPEEELSPELPTHGFTEVNLNPLYYNSCN